MHKFVYYYYVNNQWFIVQKYECYTFYDQYSKFYTFSTVYQMELWN